MRDHSGWDGVETRAFMIGLETRTIMGDIHVSLLGHWFYISWIQAARFETKVDESMCSWNKDSDRRGNTRVHGKLGRCGNARATMADYVGVETRATMGYTHARSGRPWCGSSLTSGGGEALRL